MFVILKKIFRSGLNFFFSKQFKISIGNNLWLTFPKGSFENCNYHLVKIR